MAQNDYSCYVSSCGTDLFDDYKGQDCIILDDFRPEGFCVSDILKILDNHTQSMVRARYHNKFLECKLMIITTSLSMEALFRDLSGDRRESITQLRRRCELYIKMTPLTMNVSIWQSESLRYMYVGTYDNPVSERFIRRDRTLEEAKEYVNNVFLFPKRSDSDTISKAENFKDCTDDEKGIFTNQMELSV